MAASNERNNTTTKNPPKTELNFTLNEKQKKQNLNFAQPEKTCNIRSDERLQRIAKKRFKLLRNTKTRQTVKDKQNLCLYLKINLKRKTIAKEEFKV